MIKDFEAQITRLGVVQAAQSQMTAALVPWGEGHDIVTPTVRWNQLEVNPSSPSQSYPVKLPKLSWFSRMDQPAKELSSFGQWILEWRLPRIYTPMMHSSMGLSNLYEELLQTPYALWSRGSAGWHPSETPGLLWASGKFWCSPFWISSNVTGAKWEDTKFSPHLEVTLNELHSCFPMLKPEGDMDN